MDKNLLKILDKKILTKEEFDLVWEHEDVEKIENCGYSGKYYPKIYYNCMLINGEEYNIYVKD